ncbi:hypothetical protein [Bifidobacterium sp. ESL0790]|uniref:hypothetical protein n=1 Tax=Bifidobacterium sp. ESL0790 TaxID=2983233 RepID=UPI0023F6EA5A|nr:hypothetical protein [Bifidobacterium sp. ESL0790]WEV72879.1 hypothetical protein OZY47_02665 [Bifidobacterium sp. ESL0790]
MERQIEHGSRVTVSQRSGDASVQVSVTEVDVRDGDCFNPETCCDAREKALINELRALLRPTCAPQCLITRLEATLDRCCLEDQAGDAKASCA